MKLTDLAPSGNGTSTIFRTSTPLLKGVGPFGNTKRRKGGTPPEPHKDTVRFEHCCGGEANFHVYAAESVDKEESVRRMGSEDAIVP